MKTMASLVAATLAVGLMAMPTVAQDAPKPAEGETPAPTPAPRPTRPEVKWTTIKITVVNQEGEPVAGAGVAAALMIRDGKPAVGRGNLPTTNDDGTMTTRMAEGRVSPLVAYCAEAKHAGWVTVTAEGDEMDVKIVVGPVGTIKGSMKLPEDKGTITAGTVTLNVRVEGMPRPWGLVSVPVGSSFEIPAPVGEFSVMANPGTPTGMPAGMWHYDFIPVSRRVNVKAGEEVDTGELEIGLSGAAQLLGKEFPEWKVSESRNAPDGVQIKDYRGKWVLIEFWGFW